MNGLRLLLLSFRKPFNLRLFCTVHNNSHWKLNEKYANCNGAIVVNLFKSFIAHSLFLIIINWSTEGAREGDFLEIRQTLSTRTQQISSLMRIHWFVCHYRNNVSLVDMALQLRINRIAQFMLFCFDSNYFVQPSFRSTKWDTHAKQTNTSIDIIGNEYKYKRAAQQCKSVSN